MGTFISTNAKYNSTYEEAQLHVKRRRLIELNAFGISLFGNNGSVVLEENFQNVEEIKEGLKNKSKMNFYIQYMPIVENETSASVPSYGSFVNVGMQLDTMVRAGENVPLGIQHLIEIDFPNKPALEVYQQMDRMPGVNEAWDSAVTESWEDITL